MNEQYLARKIQELLLENERLRKDLDEILRLAQLDRYHRQLHHLELSRACAEINRLAARSSIELVHIWRAFRAWRNLVIGVAVFYVLWRLLG